MLDRFLISTTKTLLVFHFITSATAQLYQSQGLVAYFPFNDGSTFDESGNKNHLVAVGGPVATVDMQGNPNSAMHFNGNGQYLIRSGFSNLSTGNSPRTVSALVDVNAFSGAGGWSGIVAYGSGERAENFGVSLFTDKWASAMWVDDLISTVPAQLHTWVHVVSSHDGNVTRLYLNGIQIAQAPLDLSTGTDSITVGLAIGMSYYFNGKIDEIRIHSRALFAEEVFALFQSDFQTPTPSTSPGASPSTSASTSTTTSTSASISFRPSTTVTSSANDSNSTLFFFHGIPLSLMVLYMIGLSVCLGGLCCLIVNVMLCMKLSFHTPRPPSSNHTHGSLELSTTNINTRASGAADNKEAYRQFHDTSISA